VDAKTFEVTDAPERCASLNSSSALRANGIILCPKAYLWQPELWRALYERAFTTQRAPILPVSGYYCGETCEEFPVPAGYYMYMCKLFDIDECRSYNSNNSSTAAATICGEYSDCMNTVVRVFNSQEIMTFPGQGAMLGIGYKCVCKHGFFTEQVHPVVCTGQGIEMAFFLTENVANSTAGPVMSVVAENATASNASFINSNTTQDTALQLQKTGLLPIMSSIFAIQQLKMQILRDFQQCLPEMYNSLHMDMDLLESATILSNSILLCISNEDGVYQTGTGLETYNIADDTRTWKVVIRLSTTFIQIADSTAPRAAAIVHQVLSRQQQVLSNNSVQHHFVLHTRKVCTLASSADDTANSTTACAEGVPVQCSDDRDCNSGSMFQSTSSKCSAKTAYLQSMLIDTNSRAQNVDASLLASSVFIIKSVQFDMALLEWNIALEIDTSTKDSVLSRSLFLSKTIAQGTTKKFSPYVLQCGNFLCCSFARFNLHDFAVTLTQASSR